MPIDFKEWLKVAEAEPDSPDLVAMRNANNALLGCMTVQMTGRLHDARFQQVVTFAILNTASPVKVAIMVRAYIATGEAAVAIMTPCSTIMDLLERWPTSTDTLDTQEIMHLGGQNHDRIYRWLIRLATFGYFTRNNASQPRGGTKIYWTITTKGRASQAELQRINA